MTHEEYSKLFHRAHVNLVAFKPVFHCDAELMHMVEMAVAAEREACAKVCDEFESDADPDAGAVLAAVIRARGQT